MGRYVGISLNDDEVDICVDNDERLRSLPAVICKEKNGDSWLIGEAAYKSTLHGSGVMVDKLLSLLKKDGTATIDKRRYTASGLLTYFFKLLFAETLDRVEDEDCFVLSIRHPEPKIRDKLHAVLASAGASRDRIFLVSHTESFVHYMLKQDKNLYNRMVGMFELSNQCLYYYEMMVSRGQRKYVLAASEAQEEAFNLDILKSASGMRIADRILTALAERNMNGKSYSSVFLCGKGFEKTDFAENFMAYICSRRRVCVESRLIAIGAMHHARDRAQELREEYVILCDTRVSCDVSMKVVFRGKESNLSLVSAGDRWMEHRTEHDAILEKQNYIDFQVMPLVGNRRPLRLRMMLEGLPEREDRTTRVRITTSCPDGDHMRVAVRDLGFGDLAPKSDYSLTEEINLRLSGKNF